MPTAEAAAHADPSIDVAAEKAALRRRLRAWRRAVPVAERAAAALAAADLFPLAVADRCVALYWPAPGEFDCLPLALRLEQRGGRLALPTTPEGAETLRFRLWRRDAPLVAGRFAAEPDPAAPEVIPDLILAPLLGFDRRLNRLGQGGGWYDRTLAALAAAGRRPLVVGLAYAGQEVAQAPVTPGEDQPVDAVLTEREWIDAPSAAA